MKISVSFYPPEEIEQFFAVEKAIKHTLNDPTMRREIRKEGQAIRTFVYITEMKTEEGKKAVKEMLDYFMNRRINNGI